MKDAIKSIMGKVSGDDLVIEMPEESS